MKLYQLLTNKKDDLMLYEENILDDSGRLTEEGHRLVGTLMALAKSEGLRLSK